MPCAYGEPRAVATTIIIKKLKSPKRHSHSHSHSGETKLDKHGHSVKESCDVR